MEDLQLRNRSPKTIEAYVAHVACFAKYFGRSPEALGAEQVRQYQLYLLQERKVSWSTFNQCVSALRFLYGTTLGRRELLERLPYGRRPKKLPVVLSRAEALELLSCISQPKHRLVLTTMYATGLRVSEAVALSVADIDSRRMTILVARGKGNKQRLVPLSAQLLEELRCGWQMHRHPVWLFPGGQAGRHLAVDTVQRACQTAVLRAGLKKPISTHTLRHTFATELLEAGVDLLTIQKILGHRCLSTTAIYTHVRRDHLQAACQALDLLPLEQLRGENPLAARIRPARRLKSPTSFAAMEPRSSSDKAGA